MNAQRIIVNADDLGLSQEVNDAIFTSIAEGRVSSASMLVNGDAFEAAAAICSDFPGCSFGVHLNLTQFAPLSGVRAARSFGGADGKMSGAWRERNLGPGGLQAAYEEFCSQLERAGAALGKISHVDSHHHVHTIPALFPVLAAVVWRHGVRRVRLSRNHYGPDEKASRALLARKRIWNGALRHLIGARTATRFTDLATLVAAPVAEPNATVEVMVHPGHPGYVEENAILSGDWRGNYPLPTELISYDGL
jgi:predicted glycoside hydrolase/deacetylase ChbG (UPF0249 family)